MHNQPTSKRAAFSLYTAYAYRKHGAAVTDRDERRREQIAFTYPQQPPYGTQYARQLPRVRINTRQEIEADARRQAALEADAEGEYDLEEDPRYYDTRLPTSTRRYSVSPEQVYQQGNTRYHVKYVDMPRRKSRQSLPPPERERYTEAYQATSKSGRRIQLHPLVWIGVFCMFLVLGWFGLNAFTNWYQGMQDDWTYGKQRHFEINAVVGHGDSPTNPSHFTAENNNGQIIVIELPGNNVAKAKIYQIETVPGNAGNPPVKLSFQDVNGDGRLDMIVEIGDGSATIYVTLFNNGSEFVSKL